MDYILTRVTMLIYVICCVSLFVLFPYYGKNMTVKSDLKPLTAENNERHWCVFLFLKHD